MLTSFRDWYEVKWRKVYLFGGGQEGGKRGSLEVVIRSKNIATASALVFSLSSSLSQDSKAEHS